MPTRSERTSGERAVPAPLLLATDTSLTPGLALCPPCRELSREPHLASSPRDEALVQLLLQRWQDPESGLDSAEAPTYEVLLSFPSQEQPNLVTVGEVPCGSGDACAVGSLQAQP